MPELPEVETIKNDLRRMVVGRSIERAEVVEEGLVEEPGAAELERRLSGRRIEDASRRAKHLIVSLDGGESLVFQLKIGGQLLLVPPAEAPTTSLMAIFHLDGGRRLFLRDETHFTRVRLLDAEGLRKRLAVLGPEPFSEEFTPQYMKSAAGSRRVQIKSLILDQKFVAGVGNIYADEILYDAGLHPRRRANTLTERDWTVLYEAIVKNLSSGIEHRGTTVRLYRDALDRPGSHQDYLRVFERHGRECPECGDEVVRERIGGRATHYCPACQRLGGEGEETLTLPLQEIDKGGSSSGGSE